MYRVKLLDLRKKVLFETVCFSYPNERTLEHILSQVNEDCFVDISRLREVDSEGLEFELDQSVGVEIGKWK